MHIKIKGRDSKIFEGIIDYTFFLFGSVLYAFGFAFFIDPNRISPGGITGVAAVVNYLFGLPTGAVFFALNLPVLFLGLKKIGSAFVGKTLFVTVITSVFIDLFSDILPDFTGERLLAAIFGGALSGLGLSLVMLKGGTTGGVDVIAVVLRKKFPYMSMGRLVLILDGVVIALATISYGELESALFAVIAIFVSGKVMDAMLYGKDQGRLVFIITNNGSEVASAISKDLNRGVTVVPSYGGYRQEKNITLLCAIRHTEVSKVIETVRGVDPAAFTVVALTGGIFGRGFDNG